MKKRWLMGVGILLWSGLGMAQNEVDALRYSQLQFGGTSRYIATGGAFGALGGDFSTLSSNPAGLGVYRKTEITVGTGLFLGGATSRHYGTSTTDFRGNFNIGNLGLVANIGDGGSSSGWQGLAVGIGYNRLANFHSRVDIVGVNDESSLLDVYRNIAQGQTSDDLSINAPFDAYQAWQTFLIDSAGGPTNYITAIPSYGQTQRNTIVSRGSIGEYVFSLGANYENRLYLGGTIGISSLRYLQETTYSEALPVGDTTTTLNAFNREENLTTRGTGINAKFGVIYRLHDYVRLGAAFHTPTIFSMRDTWETSTTADFQGSSSIFTSDVTTGEYDYGLVTPYRAIGSIAFIFAKNGFLSFDYEYLDYSSARLRGRQANNYDFDPENTTIQNSFSNTANIRLGGEWRLDPWRLRAGYALYGSPFSSALDNDGARTSYTAGFGYREDGFFIDFAYVLTTWEQNFNIYDPSLVQSTQQDFNQHLAQITLGWRY